MKTQLQRGQYHLTTEQIRRLTETAFNARDRLIIMLMSGAGLRRSEVLNLRCEDIRDDPGLEVTGKGNKTRFVPISPALYQEIKFFIKNRTGIIFTSFRKPYRKLTPDMINKILTDIGRAAGIENPAPGIVNINCHILRHSYARTLKAAGLSMEGIKNILGHSSIKTTMDVYGLMSKEDLKTEYNKKLVFV